MNVGVCFLFTFYLNFSNFDGELPRSFATYESLNELFPDDPAPPSLLV